MRARVSAYVASAAVYAGELSVVAGIADTARMEFACSVSADKVNSQTRRRGIQRAATRSARPRVGSPCSRLGLHFAGLVFGFGTVLVVRGGLVCIARVVVDVGMPERLVEWNYNMVVVVLSPERWVSS